MYKFWSLRDASEATDVVAVMSHQLGGTIPGLNHSFGSQPLLNLAEDPSLYVNFDDEDEDFPAGPRGTVTYDQQPQRRPATAAAALNPPSRLRQATHSASAPPIRPSSAAAVNPVPANAADQELENLRRRIAEKERQIKAQRQSVQGGTNNVARINPALGPVLRGLHRKPSPVAEDTSKQVDAFLKEVASGMPAKSAGMSTSRPIHMSQTNTC